MLHKGILGMLVKQELSHSIPQHCLYGEGTFYKRLKSQDTRVGFFIIDLEKVS